MKRWPPGGDAQWAMGILVYQLLSGHLPFWDAQSDRSPLAVMSAILNQEVHTPRHVSCCSKVSRRACRCLLRPFAPLPSSHAV